MIRRSRIKRRGVVDEDVEAAEGLHGGDRERGQLTGFKKVTFGEHCRSRPNTVQFVRQLCRNVRRAAVMEHDVCAGSVQRMRDGSVDAPRGAGDERSLAVQCSVRTQL